MKPIMSASDCPTILYGIKTIIALFQLTFTDDETFKQGLMGLLEVEVSTPAFDITTLYINVVRIGKRMSNFFMVGAAYGEGVHNITIYHTQFTNQTAAMLLNNSVFYHISSKLVLGAELVIYVDAGFINASVGFYPQIYLELTNFLKLQSGLGFIYRQGQMIPQFLARLVSSGS